jgi:hypothetical protein
LLPESIDRPLDGTASAGGILVLFDLEFVQCCCFLTLRNIAMQPGPFCMAYD